jgi:hypothetical protein
MNITISKHLTINAEIPESRTVSTSVPSVIVIPTWGKDYGQVLLSIVSSGDSINTDPYNTQKPYFDGAKAINDWLTKSVPAPLYEELGRLITNFCKK